VILENAVWHHFILLFNQYDAQKGGSQNFTAFLPSRAMDFDVRVERTATPTFETGGDRVATERYRLVASSGLILDVWTDLSRVPLLIVIEAQGVKVIRQGSERLADAVLKPAIQAGIVAYPPESFAHFYAIAARPKHRGGKEESDQPRSLGNDSEVDCRSPHRR
jgi:hypothetical protein